MTIPLMPKATAVWLIENTALGIKQIAKFCGLHMLEVQNLADSEATHGMLGFDPIASAQLTLEEKLEAKEYKIYVKLWNKNQPFITVPMMSLDEFLEHRALWKRQRQEAHNDWLERQKQYAEKYGENK